MRIPAFPDRRAHAVFGAMLLTCASVVSAANPTSNAATTDEVAGLRSDVPAIMKRAAATGAMRAFKDPETGALRQPDHDELARADAALSRDALKRGEAAAAQRGAAGTGRKLAHPSGAVGYTADDRFISYSVAKKNADGSISVRHPGAPDHSGTAVNTKERGNETR